MTAETTLTAPGTNEPGIAKLGERPRSRSFWEQALYQLRRDRLTIAGIAALLTLTFICIFAPPFLEQQLSLNSNRTDVLNRYKPPGFNNNILGTDALGRDQLVRLLYGGRVSLGVAYGASIMSMTIGLVVGMVAGYYGGMIDDLITWVVSTLSSIPFIFILILVAIIFTPSPEVLIILLGVLGWIGTCRLVRGEVLSLKEREFIVAARALGAPSFHILLRHMLPNLISLVIISLTIDAGSLILVESGLSYLGLGIRAPTPSWGNMLTESRKFFATAPFLVFWPGVMIVITVLCFFLVGDGLRDALDPRSRK